MKTKDKEKRKKSSKEILHLNRKENEFEIYFSDLNEEAQKRFLEFEGIKKPEDGNLDIVPLAIVPKSEDEV